MRRFSAYACAGFVMMTAATISFAQSNVVVDNSASVYTLVSAASGGCASRGYSTTQTPGAGTDNGQDPWPLFILTQTQPSSPCLKLRMGSMCRKR